MNKKSCSYSTNLRISAFLDFSANRQQRNSRITALRFVYIFLAICPFGWIGATFFHIWNTPNPGGFPTIQEFLFDLFSNNWGTITLFLFNVLIYLFVCFWGFILLKYQTHIKTTILLSAFWGLVIIFLCLHPSLLGIDILYLGTRLESNLERFLWGFAQPQLAVILFTALITLYYSLCKRSRSPQQVVLPPPKIGRGPPHY